MIEGSYEAGADHFNIKHSKSAGCSVSPEGGVESRVCVLSCEYEAYLSKESGRLLWQKIRASIKIVCKPNHVFVAILVWLFYHHYHSRALRSCRSFVLRLFQHFLWGHILLPPHCFFGLFFFRGKGTAKTIFCADMEIKQLDVCFVYLMISFGSCMQ